MFYRAVETKQWFAGHGGKQRWKHCFYGWSSVVGEFSQFSGHGVGVEGVVEVGGGDVVCEVSDVCQSDVGGVSGQW